MTVCQSLVADEADATSRSSSLISPKRRGVVPNRASLAMLGDESIVPATKALNAA